MLAVAGLVTMYSAGFDHGTRFVDHGRNMALAFGVLFLAAQMPPQQLMRLAIPLYVIGLVLLVATAVPGLGVTQEGRDALAQRRRDDPAERDPEDRHAADARLVVPAPRGPAARARLRDRRRCCCSCRSAFIVKQPDLGTAILVLSAGLYVIFFAGLSWKLIVPVALLGAAAITAVVVSEDKICQPEVKWPMLRDYQKNRVCTLLDPTTDPLGKGFHIIQGEIAIGSGGTTGKGFMKGTQTHLEFIPERTTDFIFAAFSEEFGLVGCCTLLLVFVFLIFRGLMIAAEAPTVFTRLLAGAITLSFFTYAFVNMGMVSGILPVVGVPLPFISYGGTAMVTLGLGLGILMSIAKSRRLVQS